jgi:transcriptional regulator with XRE-family HTH domain
VKKDLPKIIGTVLKEIRLEKELSQKELADYSDVDRAYISQLELGDSIPSVVTIFKLAEVLKVKPHEIINRIEQRSK